jgi:hypothetical protein
MSEEKPGRRLTSLWLLVALVLTPVVASYLFFYFAPPAQTVNYGALIGPHPLPEVTLELVDGTPFPLSRLKGKWVLAMIGSGHCDAHCEEQLLYMRQLRLTQGKEMHRVERAWLITDGAAPPAGRLTPFEGTWLIRAGGSPLLDLFPAPGMPADHLYVIDPLGNLMMRFPRDPDPSRMIKDLTRLLKVSRVG